MVAIISANLNISAYNWSDFTILLTNPNVSASYALNILPVYANSLKREELAFYKPSLYKVPMSGALNI